MSSSHFGHNPAAASSSPGASSSGRLPVPVHLPVLVYPPRQLLTRQILHKI